MKKLTILICSLIVVTISLTFAHANRTSRSWDNLIESAEFIAMASLTKVEENHTNQKAKVNFKIFSVYKGERVENIEFDTLLGRAEDTVWFHDVGCMYILFLEKARAGYVCKYNLSAENFFKITHLREPSENHFSVISEESYNYLTGIPEELFTEREIRVGAYGKNFDFKAKVMESFKVEQWLWKNFPADFTRPKVKEQFR